MDKTHLTADALCDLAEGLMSPGDRREAESHLAGCAECRREAEAMQGYFREMAGLETLKAPDRFLTKVHGRIAQASPWRRLLAALSSPRFLPVPLMGLAVVLVGVYFAFLSPRLAEQVPAEAVAISSPPAPEPTVQLAQKQKRNETTAAASPQAGAAAEATPEIPSRVAMAPPRPVSRATRDPMAPDKPSSPPPAAPKAANRVISLAQARKSVPDELTGPSATDRDAVGKAASERTMAEAATESAPHETETLAMADKTPAAEARKEEKAKDHGPGKKAGSHNLKKVEVVGWQDNPSAVYILDNSQPAGSEALRDQIANSRGPADLLEDSPTPSAAKPAAEAEAAPVEKGAAVVAMGGSKEEDMRQLEAGETEGYASSEISARKRSAPAAAPPATTSKPWAPLAYILKAKTGDPSLRNGLAKLGVKVLRQDQATGRRYELEVPATRIIDLEAYLKSQGSLTPSSQPVPGRKNGAPLFLTLKVVTP